MKARQQYTLRNVPASVDAALRRKASDRGISLNALLLELLARESGVRGRAQARHDLDEFAGTWVSEPKVERALSEQRRVDPKDWI